MDACKQSHAFNVFKNSDKWSNANPCCAYILSKKNKFSAAFRTSAEVKAVYLATVSTFGHLYISAHSKMTVLSAGEF